MEKRNALMNLRITSMNFSNNLIGGFELMKVVDIHHGEKRKLKRKNIHLRCIGIFLMSNKADGNKSYRVFRTSMNWDLV